MRKWVLIFDYARRKGKVLAWALPLGIISGGLTVLQPWPMKILVDNVLGTSPLPPVLENTLHALSLNTTPSALLKVVAIAGLGLFAATRTVGALLAWISIRGSWETVHSLAESVFARLQRRSLAFHKKSAVGELMSRVLGDSRCAQEILENLLFAPICRPCDDCWNVRAHDQNQCSAYSVGVCSLSFLLGHIRPRVSAASHCGQIEP